MKRKKLWLPLLLLVVLAVWYLGGLGQAAPSPASEPVGALTLLPPADSAPPSLDSGLPAAEPAITGTGALVQPLDSDQPEEPALDEGGSYDSREDVALYLHLYGRLPGNYLTKAEARALGWTGGSVEAYAPGKCIGGSAFGNNEGLLPEASGREYYECDIDTLGASSRGPRRIVYSNDGLVYYTGDHYESFELLYGDPS